MNLLIADSGGTKTDWAWLSELGLILERGKGLHPAYMTVDEMSAEINDQVGTFAPVRIAVYGAGCYGQKPSEKMTKAFKKVFGEAEIEVFDDLTGVARAHLQQQQGIMISLGTGSICGRYSNGVITERSAALGFAIGDEGSAADLGKRVIRSFFRHNLDDESVNLVTSRLENTSYAYWMDKIYNSLKPNSELAAVAGLVFSGNLTNQLQEILKESFNRFLDSQLRMLTPGENEKIVFTGTVAISHRNLLKLLMKGKGFRNIEIMEDVIEGLAVYHQNEKTD